MFERIKIKLREKAGESLIETMVSLLIAVLALTLLPGAIIASSKVNSTAEEQSLYVGDGDEESDVTITIDTSSTTNNTEGGSANYNITIGSDDGFKVYKSGDLYYYTAD